MHRADSPREMRRKPIDEMDEILLIRCDESMLIKPRPRVSPTSQPRHRLSAVRDPPAACNLEALVVETPSGSKNEHRRQAEARQHGCICIKELPAAALPLDSLK